MDRKPGKFIHFIIAFGIVAIGVFGMIALTLSKPPLEKRKPKTTAPLVRVIDVKLGRHMVRIQGQGTVRPLREINLSPQVGGKVVEISNSLVDGGRFEKDDVLLKIDQTDYQLAVVIAKSKVKDSESKLKTVKEEAEIARREWRLHKARNGRTDPTPPPLVAKEPQLAAAKAKLAADQADLQKAKLNLERTEVKAPFSGRVSQKSVDIGQYVSPGQTLAALFSTEAAEIYVPLDDEDLYWIDVPGFTGNNITGSEAAIHTRFAGREMKWQGRVVRAEGKISENTRLVNVVVRVEAPYDSLPPLAVGLYVIVEMQGKSVGDSFRIPRQALHEDDTVWIVEEDRLVYRKVKVLRYMDKEVLVKSGLRDGDLLIVTDMKAETNGMTIRTIKAEEPEAS